MDELEQLQAAFELAKSKGDKAMATNFAQQIVALEGQQPQEDAPVTAGTELQGGIDTLLKGATMSLGDEIQGGIGATSNKFLNILKDLTGIGPGLAPSGIIMPGEEGSDVSMQDMYEGTRDIAREGQEGFAERHGKTAMALEGLGTLATGGVGGTKLLASQAVRNAPRVIQALAVPAVFAAEGAAYGFGEGEGLEDSASKAGTSAITSAIVGPALNKIIKAGAGAITKPFAKRAREAGQKSTNLSDLKKGYKAAYKTVDESNVKISEEAYKPFKDFVKKEILADVGKIKYVGRMQGAIDELMSLKTPTLKNLAGVRRMLTAAKKGDPTQQTLANKIDKQITDYIKYLSPVDVTKGKGKILGVGNKLKEGDALFSRHAQGTTLKKMVEKAGRATAHPDSALTAQARSLLNSEKKKIGMDPNVLNKLDDMIEGTGLKEIIRFGATMKPSAASARGTVPSILSTAGGMATGNPIIGGAIAVAPAVLGTAFAQIANKMTKAEMKQIQHIAMNKGQKELADIIEDMVGKYAKGATAGVLAATPQITKETGLNDMIGN